MAAVTVAGMDERVATGMRGQEAAETAYVRRGFSVVARNWRCRLGELDLVLERGPLLVVCEVKTRRGSRFGGGHVAVHARKQLKIRSVAEVFLIQTGRLPAAVRFDVASVAMTADGSASIELFEDAF